MIFTIKPLTEDYKEIEFRTTKVEKEMLERKVEHWLASPMFTQDDPFLNEKIMMYWTICHDVFLPACIDWTEAGREQTNKYLPIIEQMISEISVKMEDKIKAKKKIWILDQLEYLKRVTLPRWDFIELSKEFPATAIEMEIPLEIHAGKYKIKIITKIDHVQDWEVVVLSDLKSASKLWEDNPLEEYNVNNIEWTSLAEKMQMIIYSLAAMYYFDTEEILFRYIVFEKHDTKKKDKPFNSQVINFRINKQEAEDKVKETMVFYFKNVFNYEKYMEWISKRDTIVDDNI